MTDPTPISDSDLAELERLHALASPGPWKAIHDTCDRCRETGREEFIFLPGPAVGNHGIINGKSDADLIVAAVNALPGLIRTVREQRADIARLDASLRSESAVISDISEVVKSGSPGRSLVDDVRRAISEREAMLSGMAGEHDTLALAHDRLLEQRLDRDAEIARLRAQVETASPRDSSRSAD